MNSIEKLKSFGQRIGLLPQDMEYIKVLFDQYWREGYKTGIDYIEGTIPKPYNGDLNKVRDILKEMQNEYVPPTHGLIKNGN